MITRWSLGLLTVGVLGSACSQDQPTVAAPSRDQPPVATPKREGPSALPAVAARSAGYRLEEPVLVIWTIKNVLDEGRQAEFKAYVRLNRALPRLRRSISIEGGAPQGPSVTSLKRHCYSQNLADFEGGPALMTPKDGMPVTVAIGRVLPSQTYIKVRVPARRVNGSQYDNGDRERVRLRRLGCGPDARG